MWLNGARFSGASGARVRCKRLSGRQICCRHKRPNVQNLFVPYGAYIRCTQSDNSNGFPFTRNKLYFKSLSFSIAIYYRSHIAFAK
ncbi:MAG: hypothetical protein KatS3mg050_4567 [Litorilinea sp.]|nr:MAG: hypothetical protein KatS3mg050_4567 [Litorilinea sp.]